MTRIKEEKSMVDRSYMVEKTVGGLGFIRRPFKISNQTY